MCKNEGLEVGKIVQKNKKNIPSTRNITLYYTALINRFFLYENQSVHGGKNKFTCFIPLLF